MSSEARLYPEPGRREKRLAAGVMARLPIRLWPDACPRCGSRMVFRFTPVVHRACPACGASVQAAQVLSGEHAEPRRARP